MITGILDINLIIWKIAPTLKSKLFSTYIMAMNAITVAHLYLSFILLERALSQQDLYLKQE